MNMMQLPYINPRPPYSLVVAFPLIPIPVGGEMCFTPAGMQLVFDFVHGFFATHPKYDVLKENNFDDLLAAISVRPELALAVEADKAGDNTLRLAIAMAAVGPREAGLPPFELLTELEALLTKLIPDDVVLRRKRLVEMAIVFGCGTHRLHLACEDPRDDRWDARWQPACDIVIDAVWSWQKASAAWLHLVLRLSGLTLWPTRMDALTIADRLWSGTCQCALMRDNTKTAYVRQAEQRAERCGKEHHLSAWPPQTTSLRNFIAQSQKGSIRKNRRKSGTGKPAAKDFTSGAFNQGMFFPELYHWYDVRFDKVLSWICPKHSKSQLLNEGSDCATHRCLTLFNANPHRRVAKPRLLVRFPSGPYSQLTVWRCQHCQNHYDEALAACLLCGKGRNNHARPSTVWVREGFPGGGIPAGQQPPGRQGGIFLTKALQRAYRQLPPQHQALIAAVYDQNQTVEEIAEARNMPVKTIKTQLAAALKQLQTLLL